MKEQNKRCLTWLAFVFALLGTSPLMAARPLMPKQHAEEILKACDVKGGLIVHVGCGDGRLTAALRASDRYLVHGLDPSESRVVQARKYIRSLEAYGAVSVEKLGGNRLPYIDNLVNLVVSEDLGTIGMSEVMRVLCPNGVAYIRQNGEWTKTIKPTWSLVRRAECSGSAVRGTRVTTIACRASVRPFQPADGSSTSSMRHCLSQSWFPRSGR